MGESYLTYKKKGSLPCWLRSTSVWRLGDGWGDLRRTEASRSASLLRWGRQQRTALCAHAHAHTHRTRPTQALSKNGSSSLVAKIKEPLGGQPPGGNIAPVAFVVQRALRNHPSPLGRDPGLKWWFPTAGEVGDDSTASQAWQGRKAPGGQAWSH